LPTKIFGDVFVVGVHSEVAQSGDEVVQTGPDQTQHHQFPDKAR
jgi:hypothetical protein